MTEYEFANTRLGEYKRRGAELIPVFCPFCGGGGSRDRYTFALNTENHTFNCKRGSCGRSGHFTELCRAFGETANKEGGRYINTAYVRKSYILPSGAINKPTDRVTAYLNARKITEATMKAFGIGTAADGRISFPCYRSAEDCRERRPTFIKYREPRKLQPGEPKMTAEPGAEPILFGLHLCNPERGLLYITEGEIDCMSVWQAAEGMINVVSVPTGSTGFTWVESCADELKLYENLAFFGDADAPGKKMLSDIIAKFDDKVVHVPDFDAYNGAKDANEILYRYGTQGIAGVLAAIKPQPVTGLLDLAEVRAVDLSEIGRVRTGIIELDQATGGMLDGDLSVWTGKRGEGKSSFLNQLAVEAVEQNVNVCIYSGEVPADRMKYQINLCAAGRENVLEKTDGMTGRMIYYLDRKKLTALDGWYGRKIWLYDNDIAGTDEYNNVFLKFTRAFKQYDCRLFIVDNLMTVSGGAKASEVLQVQADFVARLRKFAKQYGVHVHVVVHPRKTASVTDGDEVGGMGSITNLACNIFSLRKLEGAGGGYRRKDENGRYEQVAHNAELKILKNRECGDTGDIALHYDKAVRRFTECGFTQKKYSWLKGLEHWEEVEEIPDF